MRNDKTANVVQDNVFTLRGINSLCILHPYFGYIAITELKIHMISISHIEPIKGEVCDFPPHLSPDDALTRPWSMMYAGYIKFNADKVFVLGNGKLGGLA